MDPHQYDPTLAVLRAEASHVAKMVAKQKERLDRYLQEQGGKAVNASDLEAWTPRESMYTALNAAFEIIMQSRVGSTVTLPPTVEASPGLILTRTKDGVSLEYIDDPPIPKTPKCRHPA